MGHRFRTALGWLVLIAPAALWGQGDLSTVTGVVTDATQAPIADVTVAIRNTDTDDSHIVSTNAEGSYTFTELAPGPYELSASKGGFQTYRVAGIVLAVGDDVRQDIGLAVGSVNESVTVTAAPELLNTQNGATKGAVVTNEEIQDVPLDGRDFTDIALLVPGVIPKAQGGQGSALSVNGARSDNTNFYVDGFNDRNARGATAQLRPNIDAMQEFKMETSGFSAQYGKMAGGVMNMVLKSGTNQLHGTLSEFFRDDVFDARSYFDPVRYPLHRNQYGAEIAGPVRLPRIYDGHDKTFFMLSYEAYRQTDGQTRLNNVPTLLQRSGNFAGLLNVSGKAVTIKDPLNSNKAFPDGIIPASRFDPVAMNLMKSYPLPNYVGIGLNYQASATDINHWESILGKLDHRFSDRDSLSARYGYRWNPNNNPWAGTNLGGFQTWLADNRLLGGITEVHLFSPTLINELRAGVSRNAQREHIDHSGQPTAAELGMAGSTTDPMAVGFPLVKATNYASLGFPANQPVQFFVSDYQVGDVLTWVKGRHILKFGLDLEMEQFNQPYYNNQRGTMTANGVWTGNGTAANGDAFADLLLGLINSSSITTVPNRNYMRWQEWGAFVNDDFRITPALTLNLGLRYEIDPPPHDKYGRWTNFVPSLNKLVVASDAVVPNLSEMVQQSGLDGAVGLAKDYGLPQSLVYTNYKSFAPRLGFAWRPFGGQRTVLRGGYGWFYSGSVLNDMRNDLANTFPFQTSLSFNRVSTDVSALTLANPWPVPLATISGTDTSAGVQVHHPVGYDQNYNLTVEREIGGGTVISFAYVGSKGTHLGRCYNLNVPLRSAAWYMANGTNFPRPYPPWGNIQYYDFGSNSIYNAGQVMLQKRARNGLFYRLAYTYSKSIDDASQLSGASDGGYGGAEDPRNLRLERGRSDFDRGHVFTAIFSYPLPVGRGHALLSNRGRLVNGMFGRWVLSSTITAYTGQPFTVKDSSINANLGQYDRPNRLASGKVVSGMGRQGIDYPWYDPMAFVPTAKCASKTDCSPDQYGFVPYSPGNSGRNILDGPGTFTTNATMMKNFQLAERRNLQARWEVFNIFNRPNFHIPNIHYNETSAGIVSGVADSGRGGPRTMQLALKYIF